MPLNATPAGSTGAVGAPVFDYVPIIQDKAKAELGVVSIIGLSTKHGAATHDRGRLYATVTFASGTYTVSFYANAGRTTLVARGTTAALNAYFDLTAQGGSGISGKAWISAYSRDSSDIILVPTFAVDADVDPRPGAVAAAPGYDEDFGLAFLHAQAMKEILANDLPAQIPHLFGGTGISGFVPGQPGLKLPELSKIANVDGLRVAQGSLVKAMSFETQEHLEESAAVAKQARDRYDTQMARVGEANTVEKETPPDTAPGISTFSWARR